MVIPAETVSLIKDVGFYIAGAAVALFILLLLKAHFDWWSDD